MYVYICVYIYIYIYVCVCVCITPILENRLTYEYHLVISLYFSHFKLSALFMSEYKWVQMAKSEWNLVKCVLYLANCRLHHGSLITLSIRKVYFLAPY